MTVGYVRLGDKYPSTNKVTCKHQNKLWNSVHMYSITRVSKCMCLSHWSGMSQTLDLWPAACEVSSIISCSMFQFKTLHSLLRQHDFSFTPLLFYQHRSTKMVRKSQRGEQSAVVPEQFPWLPCRKPAML